MLDPSSLAAGALAGALLALFLAWLLGYAGEKRTAEAWVDIPQPGIGTITCRNGAIQFTVSAPATVDNLTLTAIYVMVYDAPPVPIPAAPPAGAASFGPGGAVTYTLPGGLTGPTDYVVVWAQYTGYSVRGMVFNTCPSGSGGMTPAPEAGPVPAATAAQLEAIPRAYRVAPGDAGPLPGALAEAVLEYAPEASNPVEPVWTAGGPAVAWTLALVHRPCGLTAVLTAVTRADGREVRLTWVAPGWQFGAPTRFAPDAGTAGVPPLVVRPA